MAESTIKQLRRENAELRERVGRIVPPHANFENSSRVAPLPPHEIGPHLRELALHCISLARECTDARVARELENLSIVLADIIGNLEAIFNKSDANK